MRLKTPSITGLVIGMLISASSVSFASEDTAVINDEISTMQAQVMRDTEIASIERMHIANIERNIAQTQESNQRWAQQLATETDQQRRDYYQQQIDVWNRWIATDMSAELSQRNQTLNSALTNILENQRRITEAENRLVSQVQNSLSDPNVSAEQQVRNIEALNVALENRVNVDLYTTQRQQFTINALNAQMGMLSPNSDLYRSLTGAKQNLQVVLDKTAESYVLKNQILTAQKAAVENLKALQTTATTPPVTEDKVLENVRDTTSKLNSEIKDNNAQIASIEASINELTQKLNSFVIGDSTYQQTLASINVLKETLTSLESSKVDLALISKANTDLVESVKAETVADRFVEQLTEKISADQSSSTPAVVEVSKNKKGKFLASFKIESDEADPLALENDEIKELSLTLKSTKREYKLKLAGIKDDVTQWAFDKKPVKGTYKLVVEHAQSDDEISIAAKVVIK
jgi:hypothetical protein